MHPKLLVNREGTNDIFCRCSVRAGFTGFHFHSHMELYLVEQGEVDVWINQQHQRLHTGEMGVILSYDPHQYEPSGDAVITYLIVPAHLCRELDGKSAGHPFLSDPALFDAVHKCCQVIAQRRNPLLTEGCIQTAFGLVLDALPLTQREAASDPDGLTEVLLYLHNQFKHNVSLASAASALGFNPSYLSRRFKGVLGVSFHHYLTMLRLREAVVYLSKGHNVDYCAYESGFGSIRTFYRAFVQEFGCTPKEYLMKDETVKRHTLL